MSKFKVGETYKDEGGKDVEIVYRGDGVLLGVMDGITTHWYGLDGNAGFGFNLVPRKRTVYVNVWRYQPTSGRALSGLVYNSESDANVDKDDNLDYLLIAHPIEIDE